MARSKHDSGPSAANAPDNKRVVTCLERLVAFDTENPPGHEIEAIEYLADLFRAIGWQVDVMNLAPGRANVLAVLRNGEGPTLAFNSHVDVVPAGSGWTSDPFKLTSRAGNLYGRGACDAKGQVAAMVEALHLLSNMRRQWSGTLMAIFVADEEVASAGARAFAATHPKIDFCVVGEPTSNAIAIAHKGSMRPLIRVKGVPAHSGSPDLEVNPLYKAAIFLQMVERAHSDLRSLSHPLLGSPSLTVTRMSGGHADNVTPQSCDLLLDRRLIPQESESDVREQIDNLLARRIGTRHRGSNCRLYADHRRGDRDGPAKSGGTGRRCGCACQRRDQPSALRITGRLRPRASAFDRRPRRHRGSWPSRCRTQARRIRP